jgi:hypothetical protein
MRCYAGQLIARFLLIGFGKQLTEITESKALTHGN